MKNRNEVKKFAYIKNIFWFTFVIGLGTFLCPFIEGHIRGEIYWRIFEMYVLDQHKITVHFGFIILLLLCALLWLPIIGYAFYRYTIQKCYYTIKQRLVNYFLFGIGITVYLLPIYIVFYEEFALERLHFFNWGYWLLLICTTVLFICYLIIQKEQLIDNDLSEHLIIDEK